MKNLYLAMVSLMLLVGCKSTPNTAMPTYRLNSPEVSSSPWTLNIASGIGSLSGVYLVNDSNSSKNENDSTLFIQVSVVPLEGLKIVASNASNFDDEITSITALYQFYGLNADKTVVGNFSQAMSLGYTAGFKNSSYSNLSSQSSSEFNNVKWDQDTDIIDIAWILGYRINPSLLIYGGPFFQKGKAKVKNSIEDSDENILDTSNEKHKGNLLGSNLALEYRFSFGLGLTGEVVHSKAKWSNSTITDNSLNFKIDYQF